MELQSLLAEVGCTSASVKTLAEKQVVKIIKKTVLKSLPAIPVGILVKTDKVVLNQAQQKALAHFKADIDSGAFGVTLLYGVTDSGKTELYIRAIEAVLTDLAGHIARILVFEPGVLHHNCTFHFSPLYFKSFQELLGQVLLNLQSVFGSCWC